MLHFRKLIKIYRRMISTLVNIYSISMSNLGVREWYENDFIDLIKIENLLYYLDIKSKILGFILIKNIKYEAEIINISIDLKFQRQGFGSKLLDYITHSKDWVDVKKIYFRGFCRKH